MTLIQLIDKQAKSTPSGAMVAKPLNCWGVKYPVGYNANPHFDGHDLLVYYPEDHPSGLLIDGVRHETSQGSFLSIPAHVNHQIEEVFDRPRYAMVWAV